jgi:type III pantothenate kinase
MIITIDVGNHHVKLMWGENSFREIKNFTHTNMSTLKAIGQTDPLIISSVIPRSDWPGLYPVFSEWFMKHQGKKIFVEELRNGDYFFQMPTQYATTLGADRLCVSYGLYKEILQASNSCNWGIILDAGTMLTIDFVNQSSGHLGGYIFPGLALYEKALTNGKLLKNYTLFQDASALRDELRDELPRSTGNAMEWGYAQGILALIEVQLQRLEYNSSGIIIITGGDTNYWSKCLTNIKNKFPNVLKIIDRKNFIHESLSLIAQELSL